MLCFSCSQHNTLHCWKPPNPFSNVHFGNTTKILQCKFFTPKENGEQNNAKEDEFLTTIFEIQIENRKVEGLITYSTDQQIFKFKVKSGTDQEVWGVYIDSQSNQNKWTIHGILLHMGFSVTTENPNVMMRENHKTKSSEYIFICQDDLYILHLLHLKKF